MQLLGLINFNRKMGKKLAGKALLSTWQNIQLGERGEIIAVPTMFSFI
jgi:hypothetical protein